MTVVVEAITGVEARNNGISTAFYAFAIRVIKTGEQI
jgi:hypothetical protein